MTDDELEKGHGFLQQEIQRMLAQHIGYKPTEDSIKQMQEQMFDTLKQLANKTTLINPSNVEISISSGGRIDVKATIAGVPFVPMLQGPYVLWTQQGITHAVGVIGVHQVIVCTYSHVNTGLFASEGQVTCLKCLTSVPLLESAGEIL